MPLKPQGFGQPAASTSHFPAGIAAEATAFRFAQRQVTQMDQDFRGAYWWSAHWRYGWPLGRAADLSGKPIHRSFPPAGGPSDTAALGALARATASLRTKCWWKTVPAAIRA